MPGPRVSFGQGRTLASRSIPRERAGEPLKMAVHHYLAIVMRRVPETSRSVWVRLGGRPLKRHSSQSALRSMRPRAMRLPVAALLVRRTTRELTERPPCPPTPARLSTTCLSRILKDRLRDPTSCLDGGKLASVTGAPLVVVGCSDTDELPQHRFCRSSLDFGLAGRTLGSCGTKQRGTLPRPRLCTTSYDRVPAG